MRKGAVCNDAFLVCHEIYLAARELVNSRVPTTQLQSASKFLWRPDLRPRLVEYVADFARCGDRSLLRAESSTRRRLSAPDNTKNAGQRGRRQFPRASRLILFRMYYLGGAEYEAARLLLGISERTWSDWVEEIRGRVGAELIRAHMYPPARYFRQAFGERATPSAALASTNDAPEGKIQPVPCEPDFD